MEIQPGEALHAWSDDWRHYGYLGLVVAVFRDDEDCLRLLVHETFVREGAKQLQGLKLMYLGELQRRVDSLMTPPYTSHVLSHKYGKPL